MYVYVYTRRYMVRVRGNAVSAHLLALRNTRTAFVHAINYPAAGIARQMYAGFLGSLLGDKVYERAYTHTHTHIHTNIQTYKHSYIQPARRYGTHADTHNQSYTHTSMHYMYLHAPTRSRG